MVPFVFVQILAREGDHMDKQKWINVIQEVACCISIKRPKEVIFRDKGQTMFLS